MTATLTIGGVDVSAVAFDATVSVGRDDPSEQPDASILGVDVVGWRPAGDLGDPVVLADPAGRLFAGTVTDFDTELDGQTGQWATRLAAAGPLADMGRVYIGDEPWPQETDSQRVARICTLAGAPAAISTAPTGPQILARDVDHQPALDVARETADSALGVLWEQPADPDTPVRYQPQRYRAWNGVQQAWREINPTATWGALDPQMTWQDWRTDDPVTGMPGMPGAVTLHAGAVLAEVAFSKRIGDLVAKVRVSYGVAPEGGERPQAVAGDGTPELGMDTVLALQFDADMVANSVLRARRDPGWRMHQLRIPLHLIDPTTAAGLRAALAVGLRLTVDGMAFDGPVGVGWEGYVEGWEHAVGGDYHYLTLRTSERSMTEPADRWMDVPPAEQWSSIDPTLLWEDAADWT